MNGLDLDYYTSGDKLLKRRLSSVQRQGMTEPNPSSVESGNTSSRDTQNTGTNTENNLAGAGGTSPSPNSQRWRFDFDFNFDPSWLVSAGTNPAPLSMLNDWVRNRIPVSVGGAPGTPGPNPIPNLGERGRLPGSGSGLDSSNGPIGLINNSSTGAPESSHIHSHYHQQNISNPPQGPPHHHHHHINGNNGNGMSQGPPLSRLRTSPNHQRAQTDAGTDGNSSGHLPPTRESQSYVVQIQPDVNGGEWAQGDEIEPPGEEQETEGSSVESNERSPSEMIRQNPEARAFFSIVERYAPFVLLLLIKGLFDHGSGIICFMALLVTFSHANSLLKKEVSKQAKRNIICLIMIAVNLLVCIAFIFYVFEDQKLYATLLFLPTNLPLSNVWTLFWLIGVADYIVKFLTVIMKSVVLALPQKVTPFQKRGKYYLFVEQSSQLYRSLLPIYPWITYFIDQYVGPYKIFGFMLAGLYGLFKAGNFLKHLRAWRVAFGKLLQQVHYGTSPNAEELTNAGSQCPICHDAFMFPTRLSCSHIFCEECVSTWFDRERTCPMCRAKVVDDPTYRDGSTTHFIQMF